MNLKNTDEVISGFDRCVVKLTSQAKDIELISKIVLDCIKDVARQSIDEWTGQYIKSFKRVILSETMAKIINDCFYAGVIEYGHKKQLIVPFGKDGKMTRLGLWVQDKLGFYPYRWNSKGYLEMKSPSGKIYRFLKIKVKGRRPMLRGLMKANRELAKQISPKI